MIDAIPQNVPLVGLTPAGKLLARLVEWDEENTTNDGRSMPKATFELVEPGEVAGMIHYEQFCVGTSEDPEADEAATWSKTYGCRNLCTMADKMDVPWKGVNPKTLFESTQGQLVGFTITHKLEPEKIQKGVNAGEDNPYAGQSRHNLQSFMKPGTFQPGLTPDGAPRPRTTAAAPAPKATAAKALVTPAPKPIAAAAKVIEKAPAAAKPVAVAGLACVLCDQEGKKDENGGPVMVPRADFKAHMDAEHPE